VLDPYVFLSFSKKNKNAGLPRHVNQSLILAQFLAHNGSDDEGQQISKSTPSPTPFSDQPGFRERCPTWRSVQTRSYILRALLRLQR
jgi:hypothetical protein